MPILLHIETSTDTCSVALSRDGVCLAGKVSYERLSHAVCLHVFLDEMLAFAREHSLKINAVAVSCGPGSYTGLRIGVSAAKGLCYGLEVPLIAVQTLKLLAYTADTGSQLVPANALLAPMIDARRMEVYTAVFNAGLDEIKPVAAEIIDENSFAGLLQKQPVCFFGNGADKCKTAITHPNALFLEDIFPTAENMIALAEQKFAEQQFEDVAYFEPFYLKEFVTTVPKKRVA